MISSLFVLSFDFNCIANDITFLFLLAGGAWCCLHSLHDHCGQTSHGKDRFERTLFYSTNHQDCDLMLDACWYFLNNMVKFTRLLDA